MHRLEPAGSEMEADGDMQRGRGPERVRARRRRIPVQEAPSGSRRELNAALKRSLPALYEVPEGLPEDMRQIVEEIARTHAEGGRSR